MHKKYIQAFQKTLEAYDALIDHPKKQASEWYSVRWRYGLDFSWQECGGEFGIFGYQPDDPPKCQACPLSDGSDHGCTHATLSRFTEAVYDYTTATHLLLGWTDTAKRARPQALNELLKAARARRKWLLERLDAMGYEYR